MQCTIRSGGESPSADPWAPEVGDRLGVFSYYVLMSSTGDRELPAADRLLDGNEALLLAVRDISSELELRPLLTLIVEQACKLLSADDGTIGLYDPRAGTIRTEAVHNMPSEELGAVMHSGAGLAGAVLARNNAIIAQRYGDLPGATLTALAENRVLGLPIRSRGELVGFFGIGAQPPREFTAADVATLERFAHYAAIAIDNAIRFRRERQRNERMGLIADVARLVVASIEPRELAARAAQLIHTQLGYPNVVIPLIESSPAGSELVYRSHAGAYRDVFAQEYRQPLHVGITGAAIAARHPQVVNDVRADPRYLPPPKPIDVSCELAMPIIYGNEVYGVVNIEGLQPFDADDVASIRVVADTLALALKNARLAGEARQAAVMRERQRLARDLHDSVSQVLSSINMLAQTLPGALRKDAIEGERRAHRIEELARLAFAEMRALLRELRPAIAPGSESTAAGTLEDLRAFGLARALTRMATVLAPETPEAEVALGDFPVQQADVEETLFRICQEALSNSIRHSGAVRVKISGRATTHTLHVIVQDDGQGFDVAALSTDADHREGGLGLINIRERARALDGMVAIDSRLGVGTRVVIELPRDDRTGS